MLLPTYESCIKPYVNPAKMTVETLTPDNVKLVHDFCLNAYEGYKKRYDKTDADITDKSLWTNMKMVLAGELALQQFLGVDFVRFELNAFNRYQSYGIGGAKIKVFKAGEFPIVYRNTNDDLFFIMQTNPSDFRTFLFCGLATRQVVNSYQNPNLVPTSEEYRDKKTCFYGFAELKNLSDRYAQRVIFNHG